MNQRQSPSDYLLLILAALGWGIQFLLIELALETMPPLLIGALRMLVGTITLSLLLFLINEKPHEKEVTRTTPTCKLWGIAALACVFEAIIPSFLLPYGQQYVDSSVAATIIGSIPLFTILLSGIFIKDDRWRIGSVLSVIVGFTGLLILFGPDLKNGLFENLLGELAILGTAISFALAILIMRIIPPESPYRATRRIMLVSTVPLLLASFYLNSPLSVNYTMQGILSILLLGSISSGIVYVIYMVLVKRTGPTFTSLVNFLIPLVGVTLGVVVLHEHLKWNEILAIGVIFLALGCNEIRRKGCGLK